MTNEQLIIEVKKRKKSLFFFLFFVFIASLYIQFAYYNSFSSKNDFTIASSEMIDLGTYDPNEPERFYFDRTGTNRVFSVIYSTELMDHLIKKFSLYQHYGIDSLAPFHYESIMGKLMKNISVKKTEANMLSVTATDKDRMMSGDMANEVVDQINVIYRNQYLSKLKRKITFYENLMKDVQVHDSLQRTQLYNMLNDIKEVTRVFKQNRAENEKLNTQLMAITDQLHNSSDNFSKAFQLYRSAYGALEIYDLQTVSVIRKALPDPGKGIFRKIIVSIAVTFFFFCIYIVLAYYYIDNKHLIKLIFSKTREK